MPKATENEYYVVWTETVEHCSTPFSNLSQAAKELDIVKKNMKPEKAWIEKTTRTHTKVTDAQIEKASLDRKTPRQRQAESTGN